MAATATKRAPAKRVTKLPKIAGIKDVEELVDKEVNALSAFYVANPGAVKSTVAPKTKTIQVLKAHAEFVKLWGGWRKHIDLKEVAAAQSVSPAEFQALEQGVRQRTPPGSGYSSTAGVYGASASALYGKWAQQKLYPQSQPEYVAYRYMTFRKGQSVSRVILSHVRKDFAHLPSYVKYWEAILQELGERWSAKKSREVLTLTVAPSDWMRLGVAGGQSCYKTGGASERSKLFLSGKKHSFVAFIWRHRVEEVEDVTPVTPINWPSVVGRCWGFGVPRVGFLASNAYGVPMMRLRETLQSTSKTWLDVDLSNNKPELAMLHQFQLLFNQGAYTNSDTTVIGPDLRLLVELAGKTSKVGKDLIARLGI